MTRYWVLNDKRDAHGPYEVADLGRLRTLRPESQVAAEGTTDWKPARNFTELRTLFESTAPSTPPWPPQLPQPAPSTKGEVFRWCLQFNLPGETQARVGIAESVSRQDVLDFIHRAEKAGMAKFQSAEPLGPGEVLVPRVSSPPPPVSGSPMLSASSPPSGARIGQALLILLGLPLLLVVLAGLFGSSPNDPLTPTAYVMKGRARPADPQREAIIREVEAERRAASEKAEETAKKYRGTPIDYPTFFAKVKTGLPLGKRYTFRAKVNHNFSMMDPTGEIAGHFLSTTFHPEEIDSDNRARVEQFLKGTDNQVFNVTAAMMTDDLHVYRLE